MTQRQYGGALVTIFPDRNSLVEATTQSIADTLSTALKAREKAYIAISGGSTPKPVYERMAALKGIDFGRVHVCFVDERNVPPGDDESNFKMVKQAWFDSGVVPASNILRMKGELDAEIAAEEYEKNLRELHMPLAEGFPIFDLILLGMGPDGHCASLFPGSPALAEKQRWVAANWVEKMRTHRITLTYPVLNHARKAMFMVADANKAKPLADVLSGSSKLPAAGVQPVQGELIWLVDEEAAALLR